MFSVHTVITKHRNSADIPNVYYYMSFHTTHTHTHTYTHTPHTHTHTNIDTHTHHTHTHTHTNIHTHKHTYRNLYILFVSHLICK